MAGGDPERDIAYRRIHGLEGAMPGPGHREEDPPQCCAWLVRLCRACFSGEPDSQATTPRSRALENHLYQYEAPAAPSSSGPSAPPQRPLTSYQDDADAGPLLPKTAESSAPLPRPGHSRNNSSASAAAVAAAAAASTTSTSGSGPAVGEAHALTKRHSGSHDALGVCVGMAVGVGLASEAPHPYHRRTGTAEEGKLRWSKGDGGGATTAAETSTSTVAAAAASSAAATAGLAGLGHVISSTAAGRPGAVFCPVQDEDDDFCPTCLDAYTEENPKIFTECGHHFHMPCIFAWLERKDTCPMCGSPMQAPGV